MRRLAMVSLLGVLTLAGCVAPKAPPAPEPAPAPPPPPPLPTPLPPTGDWADWPVTPGDWTYRQEAGRSVAAYGAANAGAEFLIRCDRGQRRISLARAGVLDQGLTAQMTLRATAGSARYPVTNEGGAVPYVAASLAATDPFLDKIAYSRGRFLVQVDGARDLVIPNWAEFARVVEDCRA